MRFTMGAMSLVKVTESVVEVSVFLSSCTSTRPIKRSGINNLLTTISPGVESAVDYTRVGRRKACRIAPAGFSDRARASDLERETRAKLNDARFTRARVFPEVGVRGAVAITNGHTTNDRARGGATEIEVDGGELRVV